MGLIFVVQHELKRRPNDLVVVDDENALVFDRPGSFDADLHLTCSVVFLLSF